MIWCNFNGRICRKIAIILILLTRFFASSFSPSAIFIETTSTDNYHLSKQGCHLSNPVSSCLWTHTITPNWYGCVLVCGRRARYFQRYILNEWKFWVSRINFSKFYWNFLFFTSQIRLQGFFSSISVLNVWKLKKKSAEMTCWNRKVLDMTNTHAWLLSARFWQVRWNVKYSYGTQLSRNTIRSN